MVVLRIDRLHARYHDVAPGEADRLDRAFRHLSTDGLDETLDSGLGGDAYAVCIPSLTVELELAIDRAIGTIADAWRRSLASAIDERVARGGSVVVYPREFDAATDVCRSVAAADNDRIWAWEQLGFVPRGASTGTPAMVDRIVRDRPTMIPALVGAMPPGQRIPMTDLGWRRCARAFAEAVRRPGSPRQPAPSAAPSSSSSSAPSSSASESTEPTMRVIAADRVVDVLPPSVWLAAPESERAALIELAMSCVAPLSLADPVAIESVTDTVRERVAGPRPGVRRDEHRSPREQEGRGEAVVDAMRPSGASDSSTTAGGSPAADPLPIGEAAPGVSGEPDGDRDDQLHVAAETTDPALEDGTGLLTSAFGGVWYLARPIEDLDVLGALSQGPASGVPAGHALRRVVAKATGVDPSDPAVVALVNDDTDLLDPGGSAGEDGNQGHDRLIEHAITEQATVLREWFVDRVGAADPLDWVWRRNATMEVERGWIEVTFLLDDVDLRLRRTGVDFDPGYLWWRGAVVRFRHV